MEQHDLLFVYGTLRAGGGCTTGRVLEKYGVLLGPGTFNGKLYDLGGFPGAVASIIPRDLVKGELFQLYNPAVLLPFLDKYEGCGGIAPLFRRDLSEIWLDSGAGAMAWIYLCSRSISGSPIIESGDYLEYLSNICSPELKEGIAIL
ncbi:MAG: gamma-glutamylcyclotransferase [Calditrichaeota bacterium]|nr:gamma-glutamylcyclotransferase [Calditrichota bacterium]